MSVPEVQQQTSSSSRLLPLPGELRNRIYDFVTGRQLRKEVLPLHKNMLNSCVNFHDLKAYNNTSGLDLATSINSLHIDLRKPLSRVWKLSIRPIFQVKADNPDLQITVLTDECQCSYVWYAIDRLLSPEDQDSWDMYWQANVADFIVTKPGYRSDGTWDLNLTMVVHSHAKESWMPCGSLHGIKQWMEKFGGELEDRDAVMKWHSHVGLGLALDLRSVRIACRE
ncbi:hypothetical protein CC86DRAFT_401420 [Ophiobolus disseminans]|uniref:Uncharacterized protein n=1 Tax=Ophiobolus disseminans TaxID=1469910 RepID=A0A6A7AH91_9PLEO|nr:hypothetical protein CC86DRAFT_401420 [Ophiobolus disseminans]